MRKEGSFEKHSRERGGILVVAIIVIVAMLILAIPFLFKLSMQARTTEKANRSLAAFNLAEAGIDRALWEMNQPFIVIGGILAFDEDGNGTIGPTTEVVGNQTGTIDGTIASGTVLNPDDPFPGPNVRTILSSGGIPHIAGKPVTRKVSVKLERYFKSIWDLGIFGNTGINYSGTDYSNNITFDSYNSSPGHEGYRGNNADAGTNSTSTNAIWLRGSIYGDVAAGAGTALGNESTVANVTGLQEGNTVKILSEEFLLPPVDVYNLPPKDMFETSYDFKTWFNTPPPVNGPLERSMINDDFFMGTFSRTGRSINLTSADSGVYTDFNMVNNQTITVQGDVALYITGLGLNGTASLRNNLTINIPAGSSLTLILGSTDVNLRNNIEINNSGQPEDLVILGTSQFTGDFSLRNNNDVRAAIYVPKADFIMRNNIELYGAIIAGFIDMRNNNKIHYDEALKNLDYITGGIPYWRVTTWQEPLGD